VVAAKSADTPSVCSHVLILYSHEEKENADAPSSCSHVLRVLVICAHQGKREYRRSLTQFSRSQSSHISVPSGPLYNAPEPQVDLSRTFFSFSFYFYFFFPVLLFFLKLLLMARAFFPQSCDIENLANLPQKNLAKFLKFTLEKP
jgi:hypothetical protein